MSGENNPDGVQGQSTEEKREAQRENAGDLQRVSSSVQLCTNECICERKLPGARERIIGKNEM